MTDLGKVLTRDEITVYTLRSLYADYGYSQYKMSKFEEYDLYVRNKDFLVSDNVITFTDTDGRLLALKPDVTLSIIKNHRDNPDGLIKAQYNENVYRISGSTHSFKELMQVGLECIGNVGEKELCETIMLAKKSLDAISNENLLALSQLDLVSALIEYASLSESASNKVVEALSKKNKSAILEAAALDGADENKASLLASLSEIMASADTVIPSLEKFRVSEKASAAIDTLKAITDGLTSLGLTGIVIDFSLVGDMKYYNGIAMKGFISAVPESVISGGQYDRLMTKMGRKSKAVGFAVYLDALERLPEKRGDK